MKTIEKKLVEISKIDVDRDLKSHSSDPFVLKKLNEAKKVLDSIKNKTLFLER